MVQGVLRDMLYVERMHVRQEATQKQIMKHMGKEPYPWSYWMHSSNLLIIHFIIGNNLKPLACGDRVISV